MLSAEFSLADPSALAQLLASSDRGLIPPRELADVAVGELLVVHFRIGVVSLRARGRIVSVAGEHRIFLAASDAARLHKLFVPQTASVTFEPAFAEAPGGATEVMARHAFGQHSTALETAPTSPTSFEPPGAGGRGGTEETVATPKVETPGSAAATPRRAVERAPEPVLSLIGRTLGDKYSVAEPLGAGAMGTVFRGRQLPLGTLVALKVMHADLAAAPTFRERFFREAQAAARLDHPGAVRVIDYGVEPDGLAYLVTEFVQGRNLASVLEQEGPMATDRAVSIVLQILAVLGKAHDAGLVHRDVKVDNVMLVPHVNDDGERGELVKLCDFGIAKVLESAEGLAPQLASLTQEGHVLGTPEYMSPEQALGQPVDARSDLYSVGVMLFHLVTGQLPFEGSTPVLVMLEHVRTTPDAPSRRRPGVDPRLDAVCLTALAKAPEGRYANARMMRRALRAAVAHPDATLETSLPGLMSQPGRGQAAGGVVPRTLAAAVAVAPAAPTRNRRLPVAGLAALGLVLLLLVLGVLGMMR